MSITNISVIVVYFAIVLYIGGRTAKFVKTAEDYMVAGRNLGFMAFMILIVGSVMSGMTVLGSSGLSYIAGWPSMWEPIFVCFSVAVLMVVFGTKIHRVCAKFGYNTVQDYLARRFESPKIVRGLAGVAGMVISFIYLVGQFRAITIVLSWYFKIPDIYALLISSIVITVYVLLGGLYAVAYTTLVQGLALIIGAIVLMPVVIQKAGGLTYINTRLAQIDPNMVSLAYPQVHPPVEGYAFLTPLYLVSFFFLLTFGLATAPHALNNVLSAKKASYYKWAPFWAFLIYIVSFTFIKIGGLAARAMAIDGLFTVPHPDYAIVAAIEHSFPESLWVLFAIIVLAAVMSTTDRLMLTIGSIFSWDIYRNLLHPEADDAKVRKISRLTVLLSGIFAFFLAIKPPALLAWLIWMGIGLMLSTYCAPLLAGLYWKRATREGGIAGMVVGLVVAIIAGYIAQFVRPLPVHFSILGFIASSLALIIVSLLTPPPSKETLEDCEVGFSF